MFNNSFNFFRLEKIRGASIMKNISPKYLSKISLLISVLLILIFLVSCAPQLTDEELEAELAKLTPEEREELLADLESKESGALAGKGSADRLTTTPKKTYAQKMSPKVAKVVARASPAQVTQIKTAITKVKLDVGVVIYLTCGDGEPNPGELCDDGNKVNGDGCSSTCNVETGWSCTDAYAKDPSIGWYVPSECTPTSQCIDTDAGLDPFKKGITEGMIESYYLGGDKVYQEFEDSCILFEHSGPAGSLNETRLALWKSYFAPSCTSEPCSVFETRCMDMQDMVQRTVYINPCPFGCSNGACLSAPN